MIPAPSKPIPCARRKLTKFAERARRRRVGRAEAPLAAEGDEVHVVDVDRAAQPDVRAE